MFGLDKSTTHHPAGYGEGRPAAFPLNARRESYTIWGDLWVTWHLESKKDGSKDTGEVIVTGYGVQGHDWTTVHLYAGSLAYWSVVTEKKWLQVYRDAHRGVGSDATPTPSVFTADYSGAVGYQGGWLAGVTARRHLGY